MRKIVFLVLIGVCFVTFSCIKTCHCTDTTTVVWPEWTNQEPQISTHTYTEMALKCRDLNETVSMSGMTMVTECK